MGYRNLRANDDIVTIASRKMLSQELDETGRLQAIDRPDSVYFVLPNGDVIRVAAHMDIIIGRKPRLEDPDVTLDLEKYGGRSLGVSRHHAIIKYMNGNLMLVDLDSINGTFINGQRALRTKRYALCDGDKLTFGNLSMTLKFGQS